MIHAENLRSAGQMIRGGPYALTFKGNAVLFVCGLLYGPRYATGDMRVEDGAEPADTPDEFLKALGESLTGKEGVDAGMADILKTHILKATPAQNAVAQAKDAILKLAAERANPQQLEGGNG